MSVSPAQSVSTQPSICPFHTTAKENAFFVCASKVPKNVMRKGPHVTSPGNCPYLLNSEFAKARSVRVMLTRYPRLPTRQCRDTGNGKRDQDYDRNLPSSNEGWGKEPLGKDDSPMRHMCRESPQHNVLTGRSKLCHP